LLPLAAAAATSGNNGSHDPSRMIACDKKVYIYSTGGGGKRSSDGLSWQDIQAPPWNRSLANNQGIWAPDVIFLNGKYLLFGSMWNDGKASRITLLSSPTLNPDAPNYAWKDEGTVVEGPAGVTHSVIDPAPVLDTAGNLYVVWGGGYPFANEADSIFLTRLDNATGLALTTDPGYKPPASPGYPLMKGHKEGPYIHYRDSYYYLFWQTGGCCSGASSTYTIHVARSPDVKGPYTGDRTFYASRGSIHGPGHMGIYTDCGMQRFTYHYYPDTGGSVIGHNELTWGADGWPSVGAEATTPVEICDSMGAGGSGSGGGAGAPIGGGSAGASSGAGTGGGGAAGNGGVAGGSVHELPGAAGTFSGGGASSEGGSGASAGTISVAGSGTAGDGDSLAADSHDREGGCACAVPGRAPSERRRAWWWVGVALALSVRRRR
jgi:MYXO-CTERM domain-containing protein